MNHKVISVFLVALAMIACSPQVWGATTLSIAEQSTIAYPYAGDPYDITSVGNLDWVVACYSEKADSTAIVTQAPDNWTLLETTPIVGYYDPNSGYPTFSWTDGFGGASPGAVAGIYISDGTTGVGTHIAIPAGSGQITVWWVYAVAGNNPAFTLTFDDATTLTTVGSLDFLKTVVDYSTDAAQTLAFNMNVNAGFHALAVSSVPVPEPGTLALLGFGVVGLSAYGWRKRM
jgi:hypothetical protein